MLFQVQTESFEGPIDVLLQMIERRKLSISDISLASITDDYIRFVQNLSYQQNLSNITHFIVIAATLALIKSKSILPSIDLTEEEEGDIEELKKRLQVLALYKEASVDLKTLFSSGSRSFYPKPRKRDIHFEPAPNMNTDELARLFAEQLSLVPKKESQEKEASMRITVHIEELMEDLQSRIRQGILDFNSFIKDFSHTKKHGKEIRTYQVVGFLAMLEMVKNGLIHVRQHENFTSINISSPHEAHNQY